VLRSFGTRPVDDAELTVVIPSPLAIYSGMVSGFVADRYAAEELAIDVEALARRARARVVMTSALAIDTNRHRIMVEGREAVPYDLASVNIGSTVAGLGTPGAREHAIPSRPISGLVEEIDRLVDRARDSARQRGFRVVVVGGGAERVEEHSRMRAVTIQNGRRVVAVEPDVVRFADGASTAQDAVIWVTGAASHPLFRDSGLPVDDRGFALTRPTLQVEGHEELFAVGDCATLREHPDTPKAGVYAVRQGPILSHNLRALLAGHPLQAYIPQRDFLTLLNLGDGTAVGTKWGLSFEGRWVMELKDRIDRRFMARFRITS
jgi:selenide,water dikinase